MKQWIRIDLCKPPVDTVVHTVIWDEDGYRNETKLRFSHGRWFFPDMSMYVYYCPTHWAELSEDEKLEYTDDVERNLNSILGLTS